MNEFSAIGGSPFPVRLRTQDYLLLDGAGAFGRFAKTELIEGMIVAVNAQYTAHARVQRQFFRELDQACRLAVMDIDAWFEVSVILDDETMPQPDIVVARDAPENAPLPAALVMLVVEISDTTAKFDLGTKADIYARSGIAEYWVADVNARVVHQMHSPIDGTYAVRRRIPFGETIPAATVDGLVVETVRLP